MNFKKISILIALVAAVFVFNTSTTQAQTLSDTVPISCSFTRDLTLGSTGTEVVNLQTFLENKGFLILPAGVAKGYFGVVTQTAVARYQASIGIPTGIGYFGPYTRGRVIDECNNPPTIETFLLSFEENGADPTLIDRTLRVGETIILPAPWKTSTGATTYTFQGWATTRNGSVQYKEGDTFTMGARNVTLYAIWLTEGGPRVETLLLSFNTNGADQILLERNLRPNETTTLPSNLTKSGYTFEGWATTRNGSVRYEGGEEFRMSSSYTTLYAVWKPVQITDSCTFTRDLTLGSTGTEVVNLQTFLENKGFLILPAGVAKGYFGASTQAALMNWQVSVGISPATGYFGPIARAKIATECGNPPVIETFLLSFDEKGGQNVLVDRSLRVGETTVLPGAWWDGLPTPGADVKDEYRFLGWATTRNGSVQYEEGDTFTMGARNVTLYAVWEEIRIETLLLSFNTNGADQILLERNLRPNETTTLPSELTKPGYAFEGWATTRNGSKQYNGGASFRMTGSYMVLYAVWKPTQVSTPTIELKVNGSEKPTAIAYDSTFQLTWNAQNLTKGVCAFSGHHIPLVGGGLLTDRGAYSDRNVSGSLTLVAKHANYGFITPLSIKIQCSDDLGREIKKEISVPVNQVVNTSSIKVLSPNGGEQWKTGEIHRITWDSKQVDKVDVYIDAYPASPDGGLNNTRSVRDVNGIDAWKISASKGYFDWKIPENISNLPLGGVSPNTYKIRVTTPGRSNNDSWQDVSDMSDNSFTISAPSQKYSRTISFIANGGTGRMEEQTCNATTSNGSCTVKVPANAYTRSGYKFTNWTLNPGNTPGYQSGQDISIGQNYTLTANWTSTQTPTNSKPNKPTISGPTTGTLTAGKTYTSFAFKVKTTDPDKDKVRYGFDWNNDKKVDSWLPSATTLVDSGTEVTNNLPWGAAETLVINVVAQDAKGNNSDWATHTVVISPAPTTPNPQTYTVTFDGNGATSGSTRTMTLAKGKVEKLSTNNFAKTGYKFDGWSTTRNAMKVYGDQTSFTMGSQNVVLYARWKQKDNPVITTHTLSFNTNGATSGRVEEQRCTTTTLNASCTAIIPVNSLIKTGHTFEGWAKTKTGAQEYKSGEQYTNLKGNVTLYAVWKVKTTPPVDPKTPTVQILSPNGGESYDRGEGITYKYTLSKNSEDLAISLIDSTGKTVYSVSRYDGWGTNTKVIAKEATLKLTPGQYKLKICNNATKTFVDCDSSDKSFTVTTIKVEVPDDTQPKSQEITIQSPNGGEKFLATAGLTYTWKQAQNSENLQVSIIEAATSKALFTVERYDGWGTNTKIIGQERLETIPTGQYKLRICDKKISGSPVCDISDKAFTIENNTKTTPIVTYTVSFDGNNATSGSTRTMTLAKGKVEKLSTNNFAKTGYKFDGWSTTKNGTRMYGDQASFTMGSSNVTLYAVWKKDKLPVPTYTVSFDGNNATSGSTRTMTLAKGKVEKLSTNNFAKTGYKFDGWSTTKNGTRMYGDQASFTMGSSNVTLYARWTSTQTYPRTISFISGGGSGSMNSITCNATTSNGTCNVTIPANAFTRSGFKFTNWTMNPGNVSGYQSGQVLSIGTNYSFTANWTSTQTYPRTISFISNGGSGSMNSITCNATTSNGTCNVTIPANAFTRSGFKFTRWTMNPGNVYGYQSGQVLSIGTNYSFTANWVSNTTSQAQTTPLVGSESVYPVTIDLELGQTHPSVITLQKYLNSSGYIINETVGEPGSIGYESDYFGEKTKQTLIKFQKDKGISPAEGYFGAKTRTAMGM